MSTVSESLTHSALPILLRVRSGNDEEQGQKLAEGRHGSSVASLDEMRGPVSTQSVQRLQQDGLEGQETDP